MRLFGKKTLTEDELEEKRIKEKLKDLEIGSDEYDKTQQELEKHYNLREKRKDLKRSITREGKGKIVANLVSGLCLGGLAFGISRFELKGNLFTGENKTSVNTIMKIASRLFFGA